MTIEEAVKKIERTIEQVSVYLPPDDEWIISLTLATIALHAQADTVPNDPLTMEQMMEMDGEPVWVELINIDRPNAWFLLRAYPKIKGEVV